jgi:hypothetical protein
MIASNHIGTIRPADSMMFAIEMLWLGTRGDNLRYAPRKGDYESDYGRPGAAIEMMPTKWREPLKNLKAKDLDTLWFDLYYCDVKWEGKKRISNMLMEFDKTLGR